MIRRVSDGMLFRPHGLAATGLLLALVVLAIPSLAQTGTARSPAPIVAKQASDGAPWAELSVAQQAALAPLAGTWASLNADQKRKWIALSRNYPKMPPDEQARLHSRMSSWAALSPAERTQARMNFSESRSLKAQDKKAQWDAYQALPPEQKKALAQGAPAKPPGVLAAVDGNPKKKLARPSESDPSEASASAKARKSGQARPVLRKDGVDANTLLPQPSKSNKP